MYKVDVAVSSEISTKHTNVMWASGRVVECYTWWHAK